MLGGFGRIKRSVGSLRIASNSAGCDELLVIVGTIPVACPLPYVAGHVVKAIRICRELRNWSQACEAVGAGVLIGEVSLMGIGHPFSVGAKVVSPDEGLAGLAATRGEFPLRFGGQPLARPFCVGQCIFVRDLHDGVVIFTLDVAVWSERVAPVRAGDVTPPLEMIVQGNGVIGRREDDRARDQIFGRSDRIVLGVWFPLCDGYI